VDTSLPATLEAARAEDEEPVPELCKAGMRFPVASAQNLRDLAAAVQPVYDELNADTKTKAHLDAISVLKTELAAGPDSATCTGQEARDPRSPSTAGIPDGRYAANLTAGDWREFPGEATPGTFTLEFRDGSVLLTDPHGERGFGGPYTIFRDRIEIHATEDTITATWSLKDGRLMLRNVAVAGLRDGGPYRVTLESRPWVRTG
jgi:hypothetical protein